MRLQTVLHEGQPVITAGPYRYVRHPSYTGLLLAFLGLGVFFGNWLSVIVLFVPITFAVIHRHIRRTPRERKVDAG